MPKKRFSPEQPMLQRTSCGWHRHRHGKIFPIWAHYWVFAYVGLPERALEYNERELDAGYNINSNALEIWNPDLGATRKTERFKALVRKLGLIDYWRARGWPQLCHPTTGDDFACN